MGDTPGRNRTAMAAILTSTVSVAAPAVAQTAPAEEAVVYVEADEVIENADTGAYLARGRVEAKYGDRILRADEVEYQPDRGRVVARGSVTILDPTGAASFADEAEFDADLNSGVIVGFSARLPNQGRIAARVATREADDDLTLTRGFYTACEPCEDSQTQGYGETVNGAVDAVKSRPTWRLRARRVTRDRKSERIHYRDAVFEIKGVPVAYTPYFAHADPDAERKSGFLLPSFGETSRTGTFYEQPYYWAISDSQDVVVAARAMSNANPLVNIDYRKKFFSGAVRLQGSATHEKEFGPAPVTDEDGNFVFSDPVLDPETGDVITPGQQLFFEENERFGEADFRGHLFAQGLFRITDTWTWGFGVSRVTDDAFLDRYEIDDQGERRGLYRTTSRRLLSQAFTVRQTQDSYASLAVLDTQDLRVFRAEEGDDELPLIAPFGEARKAFNTKFLGGRAEARTNFVALDRDFGQDYRRLTVETDWSRRMVSKSGIVTTPYALARGDVYVIGDVPNDELLGGPETPAETSTETITRALGYVGADVSFPLGRPVGPLDVVIEPRVSVTAAPNLDPDPDIPNVDSQSVELDEASLFAPNRSPGYDVFEDGVRVTAGGRASARWGGQGSATLFVGQSVRLDEADLVENPNLGGQLLNQVGEPVFDDAGEPVIDTRLQVSEFDPSSGLDGDTTDLVGAATLDFGPRNGVSANFRFDNEGFEVQRLDVGARAGAGPLTVATRYFQFDEDQARISDRPAREMNVDAGLDITKNVGVYYRFNRDLDDSQTRREFLGLVYSDECTRVELVYKNENFENPAISSGESITVRFTLSTLGAFSTN